MAKTRSNFNSLAGMTFTRSSTGTALDMGGKLKTFAVDEPRFSFSPIVGRNEGLLFELEATNYLPYSEVISGTGWAATSGVTATNLSGNYLGIFGGVDVAAGGQDWHGIQQTGLGWTSGTDYIVQAFMKAGTSGQFVVLLRDNTAATSSSVYGTFGGSATIDATVAGGISQVEELDYGNGIVRISFMFSPNSTATNGTLRIGPNSLVSGETVIALGAQIEEGVGPTSYIPTSGATASRARDNLTLSTLDFDYEENVGTWVVDFDYLDVSGVQSRVLEFTDASLTNRYAIRVLADGRMSFYSRSTSATNFDIAFPNDATGLVPENQRCRAVLSYNQTQVHTSWNGNDVETRTCGGTPTGMDRLNIGYENKILNIQYMPHQLTAAEVKELSNV